MLHLDGQIWKMVSIDLSSPSDHGKLSRRSDRLMNVLEMVSDRNCSG